MSHTSSHTFFICSCYFLLEQKKTTASFTVTQIAQKTTYIRQRFLNVAFSKTRTIVRNGLSYIFFEFFVGYFIEIDYIRNIAKKERCLLYVNNRVACWRSAHCRSVKLDEPSLPPERVFTMEPP